MPLQLKFKVPKVNADLTNFVSSIIDLNVYILKFKLNLAIDILAENSGCQLIRAVLHNILPGDNLDKYQSLTGTEYPIRMTVGVHCPGRSRHSLFPLPLLWY